MPIVPRLRSMRSYRTLTIASILLLISWFAFVAIQYTQHRTRMRTIATELDMEDRAFRIVSDPLDPPTSVVGEERLLVVGESSENFLLCSIVRNPNYSDWRGQWKVDQCFRPDINPGNPRTPIWEPLKHYPTESDVRRFRSLALQQPWITWDCPDGSIPKSGEQ